MDDETNTGIKPEIAEYPEAGPYWVGLWAVAQHWVAILAHIFEPDVIAGPGITRRFALRCRNWLWPIEGLIRRLIIAAAMKLDVSALPKLAAARKTPARPHKPSPSVPFAVLPRIARRQLPGGQQPLPPKSPAPKPPEHRHLGFPGDHLLNLFNQKSQRSTRVQRRFLNPLHRRGHWSPHDPDYCDDPVKAREDHVRHFIYGPYRKYPDNDLPLPRRPQRARPDRSSPWWRARGSDLPEWKRLEQEWQRVIPAPRLAGRISALVRVMQAPERWIERAARRLSADLISGLRAAPSPKLKKPRLDRSPSGFLAEPLAQSHAFLDTS